MLVDIIINSNNEKDVIEAATVLQDIANQISIDDFKFFKQKKINWKKLAEKGKKNPMLLKMI
jgi:hypothetical protein